MDEEYIDSADTSADMDASDTNTAEDIPVDIPEDIPEDVPEDIPEDVPEDVPEDIPEDVPEDMPEDIPEDVPEDVPTDIPEDVPEDSDAGAESEEAFDEIPEDSEEVEADLGNENADMEDIPEDSEEVETDLGDENSDMEDIPEDSESDEAADQVDDFEEDMPEDVESTEAEEQPEDVSDSEAMDETDETETEAEDEAMETKDAEGTDSSNINGSHIKDIVGEDEYKKYQGFYDNLGKMNVSQDYREKLSDCFQKMDTDIKDVYNVFSDQLTCLDTKYVNTAYFNSDEGGFRFNEAADAANDLGEGNTFFHESAHMIDWLARENDENASQIGQLTDMAQADYDDALTQIMNRDNCSLDEAQEQLSNELWNNPNESNCVSDIFGGLSDNKVSGAWGHSSDYWANRDRSIIGKEAFAEITADSACNAQNIAFTQKYMPRTCSAYKQIIMSIKGGVQA